MVTFMINDIPRMRCGRECTASMPTPVGSGHITLLAYECVHSLGSSWQWASVLRVCMCFLLQRHDWLNHWLWDRTRSLVPLPSLAQIPNLLLITGWCSIHWATPARALTFSNPGISLPEDQPQSHPLRGLLWASALALQTLLSLRTAPGF